MTDKPDRMEEFREAVVYLLKETRNTVSAYERGSGGLVSPEECAARARVEKLHEKVRADLEESGRVGKVTSRCLAEEEDDNDRLRADLASTRKALEDTRDELRRLRYKFWDNRRLTLGPATAPHLGNKALEEVRELETAIHKALEEAHARQKPTEAGDAYCLCCGARYAIDSTRRGEMCFRCSEAGCTYSEKGGPERQLHIAFHDLPTEAGE